MSMSITAHATAVITLLFATLAVVWVGDRYTQGISKRAKRWTTVLGIVAMYGVYAFNVYRLSRMHIDYPLDEPRHSQIFLDYSHALTLDISAFVVFLVVWLIARIVAWVIACFGRL